MTKKPLTTLFLILGILVLGINSFNIIRYTARIRKLRRHAPYPFMGSHFTGLSEALKNPPFIGYYTDQSLDDIGAATRFAQIQLAVAPTILDLGNTGHEYILFVCSTPQTALNKIKDIGAIPVLKSPSGAILAKNPLRSFHQTENTRERRDYKKWSRP